MLNPVTPWTATVQADIVNAEHLYEMTLLNYQLDFFNAGDSIWLTVQWPNAGKIGFRLAFGMNSQFDKTDIIKEDDQIVIKASTRLARYTITVSFPETDFPLLRYTTEFTALFPLLIPFWPRDIVPLTTDGQIENTSGIIHTHQIGTRSGHLYFSMTKPKDGSVFYFQNLSAMSAYCDASETSLAETVGGSWPEIGFQFPVNPEKAIPADKAFTISDAFVILEESTIKNDLDLTSQFLNHLALLYPHISKPEASYQDWPAITERVLEQLYLNKGCWTMANEAPYLNAYVQDYKTPAEIMVQLAVKLPLHEYLAWSETSHPLFDDLDKGLDQFYDERIKTIVRWHPALVDQLDKSEEQKEEMVMDSWYLHHPLLNLARLAQRGDKIAQKLFEDSVDYAIKVAHHFDYNWPVFYRMTTLEVLKAETAPGKGGEKDVPGSYAHVMQMAYKLMGEKRFLTEARRALKSLEGLGFDIFYQANNTAFTAGALAELYRETGDEKYLKLSYSCLAGVFKNVQLWECGYGYGKNFPSFFSVFPLNDAPYTAAYEEFEVYAALHHYMEVTDGLDILPSLKVLIPEFIKYATGRLAFYFPPLLPGDMIAEEIKTGQVQKELWVPLEDIHDGWEKSGEVGQEVYGSGMAFGIIPRQYFKIKELNALGFVDYPAVNFRFGKNKITFRLTGDVRFKAMMRILGISKAAVSKLKIEVKEATKYQPIKAVNGNEFGFPGNASIRISW
ncbi:glycoside hydrolase family protein [Flavobacterium foetidum]|uniref:hypothetical protein n=1 Tax=Flavobacterium foetidum TaxID=2026681 RepID=UPI001074A726|nr:hypothetical protein [Flavobacterium foetidum]KAF2510568.1 hypothetical protein E0W73_17745 [Flavobacterium foetidum]